MASIARFVIDPCHAMSEYGDDWTPSGPFTDVTYIMGLSISAVFYIAGSTGWFMARKPVKLSIKDARVR